MKALQTGRAPAAANPVRGIALMFASTFLFAAMHASIREVSADLHPFEIAFFRNLFGVVVLLPWFLRYGLEALRTERFGLHAVRAAFNTVAMLSFFYAVAITPLAQVTALNFTAPIFASLLAILILGETVRLRRWAAILIGFAGTLLILRPGIAEVGTGQLLVLLSSVTWACALLVIKILSRTDSSITIISYMTLLMAPLSLAPALFVWEWPNLVQLAWLALIGLLGNAAQLLMTESLKQADTGVVMPFDFFKLIWVAALAYLAFGEVPDRFTWIGGAIIFGSALYLAYREQQVDRSAEATQATRP